jgi:peptidoglycan-associated lipoprotein
MKQQRKVIASVIGIVLLAFVGGCKKKAPVAATPPAPAPTEVAKPSPPTISVFSIEPDGIQQGQSAEMRWRVEDATDIEINQGIGAVTPSGERQVAPSASMTYTLLAKGPGGTATANATLNVTSPPPVAAASTTPTIGERLSSEVQDAFFDFDRSNLRQDAQTALTKDADALKAIMSDFPNTTVVIEGHCDERGSAEYNLGLGDRRASAAKDFLSQLGVSGDRLITISYGKERPQCTESNETCWQENRRVHFVPGEIQQPKLTTEFNKIGDGPSPAAGTRTEN